MTKVVKVFLLPLSIIRFDTLRYRLIESSKHFNEFFYCLKPTDAPETTFILLAAQTPIRPRTFEEVESGKLARSVEQVY
jgi:hypothetical protein